MNAVALHRVCILFAVLCASCSAGLMRVAPDYRGKTLEGESLRIQLLPVDIDPAIEASYAFYAVKDSAFGGYEAFFREAFPEFVTRYSVFRSVAFTGDVTAFGMREFELDRGNSIFVHVPDTAGGLNPPDPEPSYTLIIDNLTVIRKKRSDGMAPPPNSSGIFIGGTSPQLNHSGRFALWDGHERRVVSYGKIDIKMKLGQEGITRTSMKALDAMATLIFGNGPFKR